MSTLFQSSKIHAALKIILQNNFRGPRCNEVSENCDAISLSKQCFDKEKRKIRFSSRHIHYNKKGEKA